VQSGHDGDATSGQHLLRRRGVIRLEVQMGMPALIDEVDRGILLVDELEMEDLTAGAGGSLP
jgi:hypothetical protein